MKMDRAFVMKEQNKVVCAWNAPSREEIEGLFKTAGVQVESIDIVEEYAQA